MPEKICNVVESRIPYFSRTGPIFQYPLRLLLRWSETKAVSYGPRADNDVLDVEENADHVFIGMTPNISLPKVPDNFVHNPDAIVVRESYD